MKCETVLPVTMARTVGDIEAGEVAPVGTVFDLPDCFKMVQVGIAKPIDDECREACGMSDEQIEQAIEAQIRTRKGIHPRDFDLYEAGIIDGYNANGEAINSNGAIVSDEEVKAFRKEASKKKVSYSTPGDLEDKTREKGLEFYGSKTVIELRELAKNRITNHFSMKKSELIEALIEDDIASIDDPEVGSD